MNCLISKGWRKKGITIIRLVRKAQRGDKKAFLKLFQIYEKEIYRMAYIYVKNESDALDVVQEVAYRSFKNIESLRTPAYFKTWILKIAINCAINVVKKNRKTVFLEPEYEETMAAEEEDTTLVLALQDLMEKLTEEEKSIILLRFYHDYTFKEIAALLDVPLGTAKSVLYRALKKLRKEYGKGEEANEQ